MPFAGCRWWRSRSPPPSCSHRPPPARRRSRSATSSPRPTTRPRTRSSPSTAWPTGRSSSGSASRPAPNWPALIGPCEILDTQGAVSLNPAGTLLFAVNAGSNTISSFRVTPAGLKLVQVISSGGEFPSSLDNHDNLLYVLNENSGTITGFKFTRTGQMTPIPGSTRALTGTAPVPGGDPAEVAFDRTGSTLAVTERLANTIDTFVVSRSGVAGPAIPHTSAAPIPFGFLFDRLGHMILSNVVDPNGIGAASSYVQTPKGGLVPINVATTAGIAPCWVALSLDPHYAYITNTVTKTIARLRVAPNGALTFLDVTSIDSPTNAPTQFPTDDAVSRDGRFLYVLIPGTFVDTPSRIDVFRIGLNGALTFLSSTAEDMPPGVSGLAAR
jgi:DNA-binding beta-propeller fold protein YncE